MNHRAFFTEFDRYNDLEKSGSKVDTKTIQLLLERNLKLLLLTKAHVVVAGTHLLESPFAHDLLLRFPELLSSNAIIPSIKIEHPSTKQFLESKREEFSHIENSAFHSSRASEVASIIDSEATSLRWKHSSNSEWFRDRLADDLEDENSLISVVLKREGTIIPTNLIGKIRAQESLTREAVQHLASIEDNDILLRNLTNYSDFIYYLSGARTAASEGILPQENLIDFSQTELSEGKTNLSEQAVFFKLFIDTVKAKTNTYFPVDFLDAISIRDSIELRNVAIRSKFVDKYNGIQIKTKEALVFQDEEKLVLLLTELNELETELHQEFNLALDIELPSRIREEKQRAAGKVLQSVASIFIPLYNPDSYNELVISGLKWSGRDAASKSIEKRIANGLLACERSLESSSLLERQILLDFVDHMKKKYSQKLF
jgi:hypothetical protein